MLRETWALYTFAWLILALQAFEQTMIWMHEQGALPELKTVVKGIEVVSAAILFAMLVSFGLMFEWTGIGPVEAILEQKCATDELFLKTLE